MKKAAVFLLAAICLLASACTLPITRDGEKVSEITIPIPGFFSSAESSEASYSQSSDETSGSPSYQEQYGLGKVSGRKWSNASVGWDWYCSQLGSGEYSKANCGPACAVMAGKWADEDFSYSVEELRSFYENEEVSGNGWYTYNISDSLFACGIDAERITPDLNVDTFTSMIKNEQALLIVCINMGDISTRKSPGDKTGKYYSGSYGHFVVIKGYWEVDGKMYFEIYDPEVPPEAEGDDNTRWFLASEVVSAAEEWNKNVIIVRRSSN